MHIANHSITNRSNQDPDNGSLRKYTASAGLSACSVATVRDYYASHHADLHKYACGLTRDADLAEDFIQQAFVNTIEALGNGVRIANLAKWIHRCIRNLYLNHVRYTPIAALPDSIEIQSPYNLAEITEFRERWRAVEDAIDRLPSSQRTVFLLAEIRGLNYEEIANLLDRSVPSVAQVLYRARVQMRGALGGEHAPLFGPVLGWQYLDYAKMAIAVLRDWLSARINALQNWLAPTLGRTGDPLAAPVTLLVAAALVVTVSNGPHISPENIAPPPPQKVASIPASPGVEAVRGSLYTVPLRPDLELNPNTDPITIPPSSQEPATNRSPEQATPQRHRKTPRETPNQSSDPLEAGNEDPGAQAASPPDEETLTMGPTPTVSGEEPAGPTPFVMRTGGDPPPGEGPVATVTPSDKPMISTVTGHSSDTPDDIDTDTDPLAGSGASKETVVPADEETADNHQAAEHPSSVTISSHT